MQKPSWLTYKGVSTLPLLLIIPLLILGFSNHWSYDESTTYTNIIHASPRQIFQYEQYNLANNHVLNSLYYKWLENMGVKTMFLFRLPSFLMFFVYFWAVSRLLKDKEGYQLRHIDQVMLYMWPYYIYFAQARGYALAMICLLAMIIHLRHYMADGKPRQLLYIILLGCLGSISIFSFLFPVVAIFIIAGISRFSETIKSPVRILIFAISIPVFLYIFDKGQIVSKYDPAIIGRDSLFRGGTLSSLISFLSLNEFAPVNVFLTLKWIIVAALVPAAVVFIRKGKIYVELTIVLITLLLLVAAHYAFGAMYPIYRGVAYIIMLVLLSFAYTNFKKNIFNTIFFLSIILAGFVYMGYLFYFESRNNMDDVLAYVAEKPGTLLVEDVHPAALAVNHMRHNDTLDIINNCITEDLPCFDNALDTAKYVVCLPGRLKQAGREQDFEYLYPVATFFYNNKLFYKRKGW
ncbi:MAG: hypothetical protein KDC07_07650 [Chitinophagaceae bacterium]|nr:hypothetical protein [Chitinophagaceae bacterium]MCB9045652.1 hypothetical protein [Chitinophagales bacterium]